MMLTNFLYFLLLVSAVSSVSENAVDPSAPSTPLQSNSTADFTCKDGVSISPDKVCDGAKDCADGGDEMSCGRNYHESQKSACVLPSYPDHGTYVTSIPDAKPGDTFDFVFLNVTCDPGYGVVGPNITYCVQGSWSSAISKCDTMCRLDPHPSVEYRCNSGSIEGSRVCNDFEPNGTVATPYCRVPNYYSPTALTNMLCIDRNWNHIATCKPECGRSVPNGEELIIGAGGYTANRGELPWHAGIYTKTTTPYMQICGGSLISINIVISAAHCFWNDIRKQLPASNYAVAVGKLFRPWGNNVDQSQKSDVKEIYIPDRYQGSAANYQDDIAVVVVSEPFQYNIYVRPVCLNFDFRFERLQLQPGNKGKVAGWGLTSENGNASSVLQVLDLPYISVKDCISDFPPDFRGYITSDKICAGFKNAGSALCKGDSGGGLSFPERDRDSERYYLRGIASTAPNSENLCNADVYTSFTQVLKHEYFIKQFWTEE